MSKKEYFFYKNNDSDVVWWVEYYHQSKDEFLFSFDKEKIYNLFEDYEKLTKEEKKIFFKENPNWAEFFGYNEQ